MDWEAEATLIVNSYTPEGPQDLTKPLLLALLKYAPTEGGRKNICIEILKCRDDKKNDLATGLRELSRWYESGLLYPMRAQGGKTPEPSEHPSREESMDKETLLNELLINGEIAYRELEKVKRVSLFRDNYRSVICGAMDFISVELGLVPDLKNSSPTLAAHILPFSLGTYNQGATAWAVLQNFSVMELQADLCGHNINRLSNILTLTLDQHYFFGRLTAWLEPTEEGEHAYRVCATHQFHKFPKGKVVQFTTHDIQKLPLPDPRFLAIHAACAKVLQASGVGKRIDRILWDREELLALPEDGSSDFLFYALQGISIR
ncbi:unnamed protein product [Rhizoctonia solani]|uniref:HNH nuclease domain-containing protein n=1 Tax=Rhizoctonia solani TaxID=456999 RepID=A0A8H3AQ29_9AGAM|nr:unnamed protein product [Rhizoctonia solani]